jgi:hypothetical protein
MSLKLHLTQLTKRLFKHGFIIIEQDSDEEFGMFFRCNEEKLAMNFMNCSVREKTLTS